MIPSYKNGMRSLHLANVTSFNVYAKTIKGESILYFRQSEKGILNIMTSHVSIILLILTLSCVSSLADEEAGAFISSIFTASKPRTASPRINTTVVSSTINMTTATTRATVPRVNTTIVSPTLQTLVKTKSHSIFLGKRRFIVRMMRPQCNCSTTAAPLKCETTTVKCPKYCQNERSYPTIKCSCVNLDTVYNMCIVMTLLLCITIFLQSFSCFLPCLLRRICRQYLTNRV